MSVTKETQNIRRGLSDREAQLLCTLAADGKSIIGYDDITGAIQTSYSNARKTVERLARKKWLIPIVRGKYLISPLSAGVKSEYTKHEFVMASYIAVKKPHYIAYWTALNHYGFTEQVPMTVFVATTSRIPNHKIHGVKYEFVTINKRKFFAINNSFVVNHKFSISNKDKTITDALDHPEYCGGISEVAKCIWLAGDEISFENILSYAKIMQNNTIIKRLGYLIDMLGIDVSPSLYKKMQSMISSGYSLLNTHSSLKKRTNSKWKLYINAPDEVILEAKVNT